MSRPLRTSLALAFSLFLAACATTSGDFVGTLPDSRNADLDKTLTLAEKKRGQEAIALYLTAADLAWQQGDTLKARTLVESIDLELASPAQVIFANTLAAELAMQRKQPEMALDLLQHPAFARITELAASQQVRTQLVKAEALEATGQQPAAIRERIFIAGLLDGQAATDNHEHIWRLISGTDGNMAPRNHETDLRGWLSLLDVVSSNKLLPQKQADLQRWVDDNPQHPAARQLPADLATLLTLQAQPLKRIALYLPSQDRNQNVVNALRNGFLARYYQTSEQGQAVPELLFYDSSLLRSPGELYQRLQQDQVDLLIGPWEKNLVQQLAEQRSLPVPTLALNYAENNRAATGNLFQFGLSAEDEARMAANRAWTDGHRNAVVLVQGSDWGRRVEAAFTEHWSSLGGEVKDTLFLTRPVELARQLADLFRLRDSEARSKQLADTLQTRIGSQPSRRRDIDFVFLAAPSQQARQVRPTLTFQYAGDLPVYATSAVNPGNVDPALLHDLEGVIFTDTPWLLGANDAFKTGVTARWPEAEGLLGRFYAMGADAYLLASQLQLLDTLPNTSSQGMTGRMQLNRQQRVERHTDWARFHDGRMEVLP